MKIKIFPWPFKVFNPDKVNSDNYQQQEKNIEKIVSIDLNEYKNDNKNCTSVSEPVVGDKIQKAERTLYIHKFSVQVEHKKYDKAQPYETQ